MLRYLLIILALSTVLCGCNDKEIVATEEATLAPVETSVPVTTEILAETSVPTTAPTETETQPTATETEPKQTPQTQKPSQGQSPSSNSGGQNNTTPPATQPAATEPPATQPAASEPPTVQPEGTGDNPNLGGETPEDNDNVIPPNGNDLVNNGSLSAETPED